jgi:glycosyltransferase involved in cell wall biosynthesis
MEKKLLIIIPACNEAASLKAFLPRVKEIVKQIQILNTIFLVSDGSTDNTAEVAQANGCDVFINRRNFGIGTSLHLGYKKALDEEYTYTISVDADGQHDETLIPKVLDILIKDEADIVVASRYHKESERIGVPVDRDMLNISVTAQMRIVTGWDITDPLSGFWGMTKPCFKFCLENGKQLRYGTHLESLIKLWYLCDPRPRRVEIPHPAIYGNHGTRELLTREYSAANQELRVERFGTHALHILEAIEDVKMVKEGINSEIEERFLEFRS